MPKEIHEKQVKIEVNDPYYLADEIRDVDSQHLRKSIDNFKEMLELVCGGLMKV